MSKGSGGGASGGGGSGGSTGGSGNSGGGSVGFGGLEGEFRFVQRRLAAGGLKRGERRALEKRSDRLAKQILESRG